MSSRVHILKDDDWQGLYLDGVLQYQHHKIRLMDMHDWLPGDIKLKEIEEVWGDWDYLDDIGAFPEHIEDLY